MPTLLPNASYVTVTEPPGTGGLATIVKSLPVAGTDPSITALEPSRFSAPTVNPSGEPDPVTRPYAYVTDSRFVWIQIWNDWSRCVDARDVQVDPPERVSRGGEVVRRRLVERQRRVDREVGADRSRPGVERIGRRHAVLLQDVRHRGRHERGLDLAGRPIRRHGLHERRHTGGVRA